MRKFTSKTIRESHFILYDMNDNVICLLDDVIELQRYLKTSIFNITSRYNRYSINNIINVDINGRKYQLYAFK